LKFSATVVEVTESHVTFVVKRGTRRKGIGKEVIHTTKENVQKKRGMVFFIDRSAVERFSIH